MKTSNLKIYASLLLLILIISIMNGCYYDDSIPSYHKEGPTGGFGGSEFAMVPVGHRYEARLSEVRIRSGALIDAILLVYLHKDGHKTTRGWIGGSGGEESYFSLDPDEYIIAVFGTRGDLVNSLQIKTNKKTSDVFGKDDGYRSYSYVAPINTEIAGFFGRSGKYIDALGVYFRPLRVQSDMWTIRDCNGVSQNYRTLFDWLGDNICDNGKYGMDMNCVEFGFDEGDCGDSSLNRFSMDNGTGEALTSGGFRGSPFKIESSGPFGLPRDLFTPSSRGISGVKVWSGNLIDAIQLVYGDGKTSQKVGGQGGQLNTFSIEPGEYIRSISGKYDDVIHSITITTNNNRRATFGGGGGKQNYYFEAPLNHRIYGITGLMGQYINAIGVLVEPLCEDDQMIPDCDGWCVGYQYLYSMLQNNQCDEGPGWYYGVCDLNCFKYSFDNQMCFKSD